MGAGEPMPPEPEPEPGAVELDQPPPGVHADSHAIERKVRDRMRQLDRGEDEYVRTLDEIVREGGVMAAPFTQAAHVAARIAEATARGVTSPEELARVRLDAIDFWQSRLNATFSGQPSGGQASN